MYQEYEKYWICARAVVSVSMDTLSIHLYAVSEDFSVFSMKIKDKTHTVDLRY